MSILKNITAPLEGYKESSAFLFKKHPLNGYPNMFMQPRARQTGKYGSIQRHKPALGALLPAAEVGTELFLDVCGPPMG